MVSLFIRRPVLSSVLALVIMLVGALSIPRLPVSQYPSLALPQVNVVSVYPGANAEAVESAVTRPLEQQINGVPGMKYLSSNSASDGVSTIAVVFEPGRDPDLAAVDVQNRVQVALGQLPQEVRQLGVSISKTAGSFVAGIALYDESGTYDAQFVSNYAEIYVRDALKRLPGVGQVELFGARRFAMRVWLDPAKLPTANALDVSAQVRAELERLSKQFPPGLKYEVAFDSTLAVDASIREVLRTLLEAMVLVVLVILVFLQGWRATLIPTVVIPVSLVGTFAFVKMMGFSINTLTLFGLTLATGLVVDDAIVVIENISRHLEGDSKKSPLQAAIDGMREVVGPVIAISLVLVAVFVPVSFFPGSTGIIYQQFALTIAFSVAISTFASLTLTPALSALLLEPHSGPPAKIFQWVERGLDEVRSSYGRVLGPVLAPPVARARPLPRARCGDGVARHHGAARLRAR